MTMRQVMVEFGVDDDSDTIEEMKLEAKVKALVDLASLLGIAPSKLKEIGPAVVAEIAQRQLGRTFSPKHIQPVLNQPEFT